MQKRGNLEKVVFVVLFAFILFLSYSLIYNSGELTAKVSYEVQSPDAVSEQAPVVGKAMELQRQKNTVFLIIIIAIAIALAVYLILTRKKKKK